MKRMQNIMRLLVTCLMLSGFSLQVQAGSQLLPKIPAAAAGEEKCVEDTTDMRKNHMEYLKHQRNATMRDGIRTKQHSLNECINCHNPKRKDGTYARIDSTEHFCNSCHTYAAVKIDCFQCHTDRPSGDGSHHELSSSHLNQHLSLKNGVAKISKSTIQSINASGN